MKRIVLLMMAGGVFAGCDQGGGSLFEPGGQTGERWTIRCFQSVAPDHERAVNALAEELKKASGIRAGAVRTKHEANLSTLYYGSYRKVYDATTGTTRFPPELTKDITTIRSLIIAQRSPFLLAQCELMNQKNIGPPEWNLSRAPGDLSLQIAVFYNEGDFEERELAAVQYCESLRKEGIEAWYYHYDNGRSIVCIGHFAATASMGRLDGGEEMAQEVKDLIAKREEFKYNLVNGRVMRIRMPSGEFLPSPSCLVRIPRAGGPADGMELP